MAKTTDETEAQKTARLGPAREIKRWESKSKTTRIAHLECKHTRACDMTTRQHVRCRRCRPGAKAATTKKPLAVKKSVKKSTVTTSTKKQPMVVTPTSEQTAA